MTATNLQLSGYLSKQIESLQAQDSCSFEALRGNQPNPGSQLSDSSQSTQALRRLQQIYPLERRCFF